MAPKFLPPCFPGFPSLLDTPTYTDITIICGTSRTHIPAHRLLLTEHSTYFRTALLDPSVTEIFLPAYEPQLMYFILRYLYTGNVDPGSLDTGLEIYACAADLGIPTLMCWIIYKCVLEDGKYEQVLQNRVELCKLLQKVFTLTTMEERRGRDVYEGLFGLIASMVWRNGLTGQAWFEGLLGEYNGQMARELVRVVFGQDEGVMCFGKGCEERVGGWGKCFRCSRHEEGEWECDGEW